MNSNIGLLGLLLLLAGCSYDKFDPVAESGYPEEIGSIIISKCATSGCHNEVSKDAAGGLSLDSWQSLFSGARSGASVIPYKSGFSSTFLFANVYDELGPQAKPTMPFGKTPLTFNELVLIKSWIESGATDKNGFIKFSDNPVRKKIYVTNQGCDLVAVMDAQTKLVMRYIDVGVSTSIESPHMIRVSPDGKHWYVVFTNGTVMQKFRTSDDVLVGNISITHGSWNTFAITEDSKFAFAVDWADNGRIAYIDLGNMVLSKMYQGSNLFKWPHGIAVTQSGKTIYVTAQTGNFIYKIDVSDPSQPEEQKIVLQPGQPPLSISLLDPHEVILSPDEQFFYVTCQKTNEVRVFRTDNNSLVSIIATGNFPQETAVSISQNLLFVTCPEDKNSFPGKTGSVAVIDMSTQSLVKHIYTGHQPHGIAVDDITRTVFVANRNIDANGPAPHHISECNGRNGNMTAIDMTSLQLIQNFKHELAVDPYSVAIRP